MRTVRRRNGAVRNICRRLQAHKYRQSGRIVANDQLPRISRIRWAVSLGVLPTLTPAASRASFFAAAVPDEPDTMAPACPIVLPSGAVNLATSPTTGFEACVV